MHEKGKLKMNIKKFVNVLSVAGLLAVATVTPASADTLEVKLNREQVNGKTMKLLLEDVNLIAKAYQVSLKINGNVKLDTLNFSNEGKTGVNSRYVYHEDTNEVDIYVTSTESLLDENEHLDIGTMTLNGTVGESFDVVPVENSLKIVTMANVEHSIPTVSVSGGNDFSISDSNNSGTGGNNGSNGEDIKPPTNDGSNSGNGDVTETTPPAGDLTENENGDLMITISPDNLSGNDLVDIVIDNNSMTIKVGDKIYKSSISNGLADYNNLRVIRDEGNGIFTTVPYSVEENKLKIKTKDPHGLLITDRMVPDFKDTTNVFSRDEIDDLYNYGIVTGTTATTYSPYNDITRGQFSVMIARALELKPSSETGKFQDVNGKWYADQVQALYETGIITGFADGTFGGEKKLTRQQAAAMIARMLEYMKVDTTPKENVAFADIDRISDYAKDAVLYLASHDVLNSGEETKFNPQNNLTRAQMAKILMRSLRLSDWY